MKRSIKHWQLTGFIVTSIGGTLLHYLYDWFGEAMWIAPFAGVGESIFEHMKLLFWPMFIFAVIQSFFYGKIKSFWRIKLRGIVLGITLIPVIFYTYNGAIGSSPDWLNISIFFISAAAAYIYETRQFVRETTVFKNSGASLAILCIIALLFATFTFWTPKINIFKDPNENTYGICAECANRYLEAPNGYRT